MNTTFARYLLLALASAAVAASAIASPSLSGTAKASSVGRADACAKAKDIASTYASTNADAWKREGKKSIRTKITGCDCDEIPNPSGKGVMSYSCVAEYSMDVE